MKTIIEVPKIEDFKRVNELARQVHELHASWRPDIFLKVDEVIDKEEFKEKIQAKEIYIAKTEEKIVGYMTLNIKQNSNPILKYKKYLTIEAICVDENERSKGIGTLLLYKAKKKGKEKGCTDLYLTVNKENENAIKIYEKLGFRVKNIAYSMEI